jgi:hypothetical protein
MLMKLMAEIGHLEALDLLDITSKASQGDFAGKGYQGVLGSMEK